MNEKKRDSRIDIIRLVALALLIMLHFILKMELYQDTVQGSRWMLICVIRQFGMCCIPLFLLMTGYLMCKADYQSGYAKRIVRTLFIYVFASVMSNLFIGMTTGNFMNIKGVVLRILDYSLCPYAWYVELYIGLFLLIPIINRAFNSFENKGKRRMIFVLVILTALPSFANVYRVGGLNWWFKPSSDGTYFKVVPQWWQGIYPITYYCIGAYLRGTTIKLNRVLNGIFVIVLGLVYGAYNYWRSNGTAFIWGPWQEWGSWMNLTLSVLLFGFLLNCKEIENGILKRVLKVGAEAVFGAYLISWIPEQLIYASVLDKVSNPIERINHYPRALLVYFVSILLSLVMSFIYDLFNRLIHWIKLKTRTNEN